MHEQQGRRETISGVSTSGADREVELTHRSNYDVRKAAPNYSNIAAVQAGFALTAVVLIVSINVQNASTTTTTYLRNSAMICFLIAFFGSVLAALAFAVIAGEEKLAPRSNFMALAAATGFSVSISLEMWGLVALMKIYLGADILQVAQWTFICFSLVQVLYLCLIAVEDFYLFWDKLHNMLFPQNKAPHPTWWQWTFVLLIGYAPVVLAMLLKASTSVIIITGLSNMLAQPAALLTGAAWLSVATLFLSNVVALVVSNRPHETHLPAGISVVGILLPSLVIGLLILAI